MSQPPYSPDLALSDFFFVSPDEKSPQRETSCDVEEVKQKTAEALKAIKIDKFKNFWAVEKNVLIGVLHQMESTFKGTEV